MVSRIDMIAAVVLVGMLGCDAASPKTSSDPPVATQAPTEVAAADKSVAALTPAEKVEKKDTAEATPALEAPSADGLNQLKPEEISAGWLRLFDGHTLFGWKPNSETNWRVENGVIVADSEAKGLLVSTTHWASYELRCDFKLVAGGNSGVFLRTPFTPKNPATDCYELNICDSHPEFKSASLVGRAKPTETVTADGEWHTFFVSVDGPKVTVQFDGKSVLNYDDNGEKPLNSGFIGLQMNGGKVEFRNVFLRPLGLTPLFDGTSLTGWKTVPGSQGEFKVEDGTIRATGGRGFLETERTAANFVLQFDAITHGDALNSGVFFRAQPGTEKAPSNGYEFQIQSGIKNSDRNQPADFGTGAIFRRIAARRVVSSDREWLTATLVADGPHITTWVNGIPVVDWTDTRAANDNPREGLRLDAGHLSLQGHDPTTNLQFRNLRLVDLP